MLSGKRWTPAGAGPALLVHLQVQGRERGKVKRQKCNKQTNKQGKRWTPAGAAGPPARGVKRKNATFTNKKKQIKQGNWSRPAAGADAPARGGTREGVKRQNAPSDIQTNKQTNKTRQQLTVHLQGGDEGRRVKRQNATPDKQRIKQTRQGVNARTQRCQVDLMKTNKQSCCTCIVQGKEGGRGKNTPP